MNDQTTLTLERFAYTPFGTFGWLTGCGLDLFTVECGWKDNKPFLSCVPVGEYKLEDYYSPKRGAVIELKNNNLLAGGKANEKTRSHIQIHVANWAHELEGCIAPGTRLNDNWGVSSSRVAMNSVMKVFKRSAKKLVIKNIQNQGVLTNLGEDE